MKKKRVSTGGNWLARWWSLLTPAAKKKIATIALGFVFGASVVIAVAVLAFKGLSHSDFFQISSLKIIGNHEVRKSEIIKLSGLDIYSNLLSVDTERVKQNVESHEWVERVILKKKWPHILKIIIRERKPLAIINTDEGLYYIDRNATVFSPISSGLDLDYPVLSGMEGMLTVTEGGAVENNEDQKIKESLLLIRYASNGSSSLPRQNISQLFLDKENKMILFLTDRPFPIYLGTDVSKQKFHRLKKVLYYLYKKREFANVDYIRLDYLENKVLVGKNNS